MITKILKYKNKEGINAMVRLIAGMAVVFLVSLLPVSCTVPRDITYMQGFNQGDTQQVEVPRLIKVRPGDRLAIIVSSSEPSLAEVFNMAIASYRIGTGGEASNESKVCSFVVNEEGDITFPMIGDIHVVGLTRHEVAKAIAREIREQGFLKDPIVTVEFLKMTVSMLGEFNKPGEILMEHDAFTLLQAIAKAGDLTITGDRTNVLVVRREGHKDVAYRVDLTDTKSIMESPVYYLRQNDVVYVEPNNMRKRQSTELGNVFYNPAIWVSIVSVLTSIAVIVFN